jgi:hypothetical protein
MLAREIGDRNFLHEERVAAIGDMWRTGQPHVFGTTLVDRSAADAGVLAGVALDDGKVKGPFCPQADCAAPDRQTHSANAARPKTSTLLALCRNMIRFYRP